MTLDTLLLEFRADTAPLSAKISALKAELTALGACADDAESSGAAAGTAFAAGLSATLAQARSAALNVSAAARFAGGTAAASQSGRQLGSGFALGIASMAPQVRSAAQRLAAIASETLKSALDIHSPSRVTEGFGAQFGAGFAQGIASAVSGVTRAVRAMSDSAASAVEVGTVTVGSRAESADAQPINLTVPLTIDGYKLGEASIRGINRVTRATGKVLLEL